MGSAKKAPRPMVSVFDQLARTKWKLSNHWDFHHKVPQEGLSPHSRGGVEARSQDDNNEFPGKGNRRAWNETDTESHMRGVDTTRIPLSKREMSIRSTMSRAPDAQTNMHAPEDAEDAFGSRKKPKTQSLRRRRPRPGAVIIPMGR